MPEFTLGKHTLRDLKLPAIDLSPIGAACGGLVDGILGVDLLDKMGVTIDLKHRVASMGADVEDAHAAYDSMQNSMEPCMAAFSQGDAPEFEKCLDPEVVMYTPHGEFVGPQQVIGYLQSGTPTNTSSTRPWSTAPVTARPYAARVMADGASSTFTTPRSRQMREAQKNYGRRPNSRQQPVNV